MGESLRLIIHTTEFPPGPGGIGTHAHHLAAQLAGVGWEILVLTSQDYASPEAIRSFNGRQPFQTRSLARVPTRPGRAAVRVAELARAVRAWRPDALVASGDPSIYAVSVLPRNLRPPFVAVEHGRLPTRPERDLKRWSLGRAAAVVHVSQHTCDRISSTLGEHQALVIPNGADPTTFRVLDPSAVESARASLHLPAGRLLVTVGNVTARKGQDVVIRALPQVLESAPDVQYLVCGLPTERRGLEGLARSLGVQESVHFLGRLPSEDLVGVLNACDLFVMTSRHLPTEWEGYGIAVVEAALCGKPSVVSGPSGLSEAIQPGATGLSVPEDAPEETAQAILSLLEDPSRLEQMGQAALDLARGVQTWQHRITKYDALLRSLVR